MTNNNNSDSRYISSSNMAAQIRREAAMGRIVTPFRPPMSIDDRVTVITPEAFNAKTLYGRFLKYSHKDFMTIQMNRIGFNGKSESFDEPVLTVYGMMTTGLVTVSDSGTHSAHLYTLNPQLATLMCGKAAVRVVIDDVKEQPINVKKNSITCFEIIPQRVDNIWVYDCQPAFYECRKKQMITFTLSILYLRNKIISQLLNNVLDIQYFDVKSQTVRDISTTLSQSALSAIMEQKVYERIRKGVIDEKKTVTLKLPVLYSANSDMAEVFIPSIVKYTFKQGGLILGKKFDPFVKKGNKGK